jgi:alpha-tubulin suppressor-like RCC1 family protein
MNRAACALASLAGVAALATASCSGTGPARTLAGGGFMQAQKIAAGDLNTCALTASGAVQCWGNFLAGVLGNKATANSSVPVAVTGVSSGVAALAVGELHACALTIGGGVQCWGDNSDGELGIDSAPGSSLPVSVTGLSSGVAAVGAGHEYTCALTTGGGVQCWGDNSDGELGNVSKMKFSLEVDE